MKQIILMLVASFAMSTLALAAPPKASATAPAAKKTPAPAAPATAPVKVPTVADIPALVKQLDNDDYRLRTAATRSLQELSRSIVRPMFAKMSHGDDWVKRWPEFIKKSNSLMDTQIGEPIRAALKVVNSHEANYLAGKVLNTFSIEREMVLGEWLTKSKAPPEVALAKNDKRPVHVVTTAKEFAKALGNDRIIHIKAKQLDLCSNDIPQTNHFSVHPSFKNLKNTRIECINDAPVNIYIAEVARSLDLTGCKNVQLINLCITRKIPVAVGMPTQAAALYMTGCEQVTLDRCQFRNSWSGFHMVDCKTILLSRCRVENNLYQLGHIEKSTTIRLFATSITGNGTRNPYTNYCGIRLRTVTGLSIESSLVSGNNMRTLLYFQDSNSRAKVKDSLVAQQMLSNRASNVKVTNSRVVPVKAASRTIGILRGPMMIQNGAVIRLNGAMIRR